MFKVRPSHFWVSPSHFSNQSFLPFCLVLLIFRVKHSHLFGSVLPIFFKSVLLIFRVRPYFYGFVSTWHFFESVLFIFQTFLFFRVFPSYFFGSALPIFLSQSYHFRGVRPSQIFESLIHFLTQSFPFYLANFYLISLSSFYISWVWWEDVWLEMSTESIFFNEGTSLEDILTSYFM